MSFGFEFLELLLGLQSLVTHHVHIRQHLFALLQLIVLLSNLLVQFVQLILLNQHQVLELPKLLLKLRLGFCEILADCLEFFSTLVKVVFLGFQFFSSLLQLGFH